MKRVLPITIPDNFTAAFFYALPMAVLEAEPCYQNWLHMNYLDFYAYRTETNEEKYEFRFPDGVSYLDRGIHCNEAVAIDKYDLSMFACKDISAFLEASLNDWYYVILYVDESCIPGSFFRSGIHEYLVYGYDSDSQIFYLFGMNESGHYATLTYSYNILVNAYRAMLEGTCSSKSLYRMCVTNRYTISAPPNTRYFSHYINRVYDEAILVDKLQKYKNGTFSSGYAFIRNFNINSVLACGFDTYDVVCNYLEMVQRHETDYEFNLPYFLLDHKKSVYTRLRYAQEMTGKESFYRASDSWRKVVAYANLFKNIHIRRMMTNIYNTEYLLRLCDYMRSEEKKVLRAI